MNKLQQQIEKAKHSAFQLWLLNILLLRTVPFNKPHNLKIVSIKGDHFTITVHNKRNNRNHIKGIHACLLATLCEYVSGLSLLAKLDHRQYRIIMKNISMTYHYQAKQSVSVTFGISQDEIEKLVIQPLASGEKIFQEFTVEGFDSDHNHICTGKINWQIKAWKNVKTR